MSEHLNETTALSQKLDDLRKQLADLDLQRAALMKQIDECVNQLAVVTRKYAWPDTLSEQVLWVLRRYATRPLAPMDVAAILDFKTESDYANVRTHLARLPKKGLVRRSAHGRYVAVDG